MTTPNRVKIIFDGGTAEIYGDIFADIATAYALAMYDRQKKAQSELAGIKLDDNLRKERFTAVCMDHDDANSRLEIIQAIEKVFKNRTGTPVQYVQPTRAE